MLVSMLRRLVTRVGDEGWSVLQLARAGLLRPVSPVQLAAILRAVRDYGELGAAVTLAAVRHRDAVGLIDERGALTFGDLDARSNAVANEWRRAGLQPGSTVAILARNHRGLLDALFAGTKTGARVVLLNTDFGRTQISEVVAREGADLLVYDEEYADAVADVDVRHGCVRAWADRPGSDTLDELVAPRRSVTAAGARRETEHRDLDERDDGHTEGRFEVGSAVATAAGRLARQGAVSHR